MTPTPKNHRNNFNSENRLTHSKTLSFLGFIAFAIFSSFATFFASALARLKQLRPFVQTKPRDFCIVEEEVEGSLYATGTITLKDGSGWGEGSFLSKSMRFG